MVGDSVTTDHISPAGIIKKDSPAGRYPDGARRAAAGLQQLRLPPRQRPRDDPRHLRQHPPPQPPRPRHRRRRHQATSPAPARSCSIYDARMKYQADGTPLIVLAGKDYGMGSSRDWAAKGTYLLGVKAVIAESFERIHRSNLVGMGVLPLQFQQRPEPRSPRPDRRRHLRDPGRRRPQAAAGSDRPRDQPRRRRRSSSPPSAASTRRSRSSTTATAASSTRCCGAPPQEPVTADFQHHVAKPVEPAELGAVIASLSQPRK